MNDKSYKLIFEFDVRQITEDDLRQRVNKAIVKHLKNIELNISASKDENIILKIEGPLSVVDSCHLRLCRSILNELSFIRVLDESGDKLREEAFSILAKIEQKLRVFIDKAMSQVIGSFDWWQDWIPKETQEEIKNRYQGKKNRISQHPYIELLSFSNLISLMTTFIQNWNSNKILSVDEIQTLLENCENLSDLRLKLLDKTKKRSIWDEVLSKFFDDKNEWEELRKKLNERVLDIRNRVMHHRPIHQHDLTDLSIINDELNNVLGKAKRALSNEERKEAYDTSLDIASDFQRYFHSTYSSLTPIQVRLNKINEINDKLNLMLLKYKDPLQKAEEIQNKINFWLNFGKFY